jgi:hypothetical protein
MLNREQVTKQCHVTEPTLTGSNCRNLAFGILLVLAAATVRGQSTTGTIAGLMADAQSLVVTGIIVTVTGPQGVRSAVTDGEGRFNLPFLTPGHV